MKKDYEYKLKDLAVFMQQNVRTEGYDLKYKVEEVYLDYGAGIKDLTLVVYEENDNLFQALSFKDIAEIKEGTFNEYEFLKNHLSIFNKMRLSNPTFGKKK